MTRYSFTLDDKFIQNVFELVRRLHVSKDKNWAPLGLLFDTSHFETPTFLYCTQCLKTSTED